MAKDGTMRGGQRVGAGRKSKALADKIVDGRLDGAMVLPEPTEIEGADVPPVKEYLKASQKNGKDLCAEAVYRDTWNWLKARGCETLVNNQLIEQYAMSVSRWIQCEEAISEFGVVGLLQLGGQLGSLYIPAEDYAIEGFDALDEEFFVYPLGTKKDHNTTYGSNQESPPPATRANIVSQHQT